MRLTVARRRVSVLALLAIVAALAAQPAAADTTAQPLPFTQNWTNIDLITTLNDWSGVPGIIGYRGDGLVSSTAVDPQTVLADGSATPVNVLANSTNPNTLTTGGVAEFHLENPVVALQGSGTADAPHLVLSLDTTGFATVTVAYLLRDVDGSADNSVQPVALQYRVGSTGSFTNVPAGFVADASAGPSATLETPVAAVLPAAAGGQPLVQVRVITTDAVGSDEWIGIDDISVTGSNDPVDLAPAVQSTTPADGATGVDSNGDITVTFNEPVSVASGGFTVSCSILGPHPITVSGGPSTFTLSPVGPLPTASSCTVTVSAAAVSDQDTIDPPDTMAADHVFSFMTAAPGPAPGSVVVSEVYGGGGNSGATLTHDFIELYNRTGAAVSLSGWSVQYASSAGSTWQVTPLAGSIPSGRNYLVQEAAGAGGTTPLPTPDATGTIAMSATAGKVALVASTTPLSGTCPTGGAIIDFVGYGGANCAETAPTPALSNTTSAQRKDGGNQDTDNNAEDFVVAAPDPQTSGEPAPSVAASTPAAGAVGVRLGANVEIVFSEPVDVTGTWYTIDCATSGSHTATVSGGPVTFTLDPAGAFAYGETCTVTILAANVTDQDTDDPPDNMAANHVFAFQTEELVVCGEPATGIHDVQGPGLATPIAGQRVTIEGVVVGDYQLQPSEFGGFYLQEEDADHDADPNTSEGIFVFDNGFGVDVQPGDVVRVRGTAGESFNLTQIATVTGLSVCATGATVTPASISLPVANVPDHERTEGMLVSLDQLLTATEVFNLGRFGEVSLSGVGRLWNPTAVTMPGAPAIAYLQQNNRSRIILDDGNNQQNIDPTRYPQGGLSASNTLRVGDTLDGLTGVMDFRFSNYRIQPVGSIEFDVGNPRTPAPEPVGGNLEIASFNVLNYFNGDGMGGGFPTSRGALNQFELDRQSAKIVSALEAMDSDIVGLMEIENDAGPNGAVAELVRRLNDEMGAGTYAGIETGVIGTDEIKVALIYKPAAVSPVGDWKILTSAIDPRFDTSLNRPALAQTFEHLASGERLTVAVNHLKSKGTPCPADPDIGDGQGNCNNVRTQAAAALADWLATDPTGSGDPDSLVIGDLNAYTFEDPIRTLEEAGYTNLVRLFGGLTAYSYVFQGESGYLDHALANASLAGQVTGTTEWHINPDEPTVLDYTTSFKTMNQWSLFYDPGPYRASDHDPVIVGLSMNLAPEVDAGGPYSVDEGGTVSLTASGSDPDGEDLSYAWDLDGDGTYETAGQTATFAAGTLDGPGTVTVGVQVTDERGKTATDTATIGIVNVAPSGTFEAPASAPAGFAFELALTGVTDPSAADTAAGFEYAFDCGSGYGAFGPASSASCPTDAVGTLSVGAQVRDKDGGVREYRAVVDVFVTFDSLCDLVQELSSDPDVADSLCERLANAEAAPNANVRNRLLDAFRNQVRGQTGDQPGKAFTPAEGALLESLSREL
jgi:hypothetical protein